MKRVLLFLRSRSTTGMLRAASASTMWLPTKPLPPVTQDLHGEDMLPGKTGTGN